MYFLRTILDLTLPREDHPHTEREVYDWGNDIINALSFSVQAEVRACSGCLVLSVRATPREREIKCVFAKDREMQ